MASSSLVSVLALLLVISSVCNVEGLESFYYRYSCPSAEETIKRMVTKAVRQDRRVGAELIRMLFHDCFVEGCDASLLIDDPNHNAEKDSTPNIMFTQFGVIDEIKAAVEKLCYKTVSCADILALSAGASIVTLGGPSIDCQGGRFDGLVSSKSEALSNIPSSFSNLSTLQSSFSGNGLDTNDLVLLSGAHTVGVAHCSAFSNRLRNFSSTADVDPSLDPTYATTLKNECPVNFSNSTVVAMDPKSPTVFDNRYFQEVQTNKGLFTSDAQLYTTADTKILVDELAQSRSKFAEKFAASFEKMAAIGVKTSADGNIRTNCRSFN